MKKARKRSRRSRRASTDEMRPEYDFSNGVRGKYASRLKDTIAVVLARDVAREFRTARAVNRALLAVMKQKAIRSDP
jgi:hypothetical protein